MADAQRASALDADRELRGRYQLGHIAGAAASNISTGGSSACRRTRVRARVRLSLRVGYQLELNNRRDLQQQADFFSASPTRHSLFREALCASSAAGSPTHARISHQPLPRSRSSETDRGHAKRPPLRFALRAGRPLSAPWRAFVDTSYYRTNRT